MIPKHGVNKTGDVIMGAIMASIILGLVYKGVYALWEGPKPTVENVKLIHK